MHKSILIVIIVVIGFGFSVVADELEDILIENLQAHLTKDFPDREGKIVIKNLTKKTTPFPRLNHSRISELDITDISKKNHRFAAEVSYQDEAGNIERTKVQGTYDEMILVPMAKQKLVRDSIIQGEDMYLSYMSTTKIKSDSVIDIEDLVGQRVKATINPHQVVGKRLIGDELLIKRNAMVNLIYKSGLIEIKLLAQALENGEKGSIIKFKNLRSGAIIHGKVMTNNTAYLEN